jgi:hypothetical protein
MLGLKLPPATVSLLLPTNAFSRSFFLTSFACALKPKDYRYWVLFGFGAGFLLDFKKIPAGFLDHVFLTFVAGSSYCRSLLLKEEGGEGCLVAISATRATGMKKQYSSFLLLRGKCSHSKS